MRNNAKPFIKWVGGKRQLLSKIKSKLPPGIELDTKYYEIAKDRIENTEGI